MALRSLKIVESKQANTFREAIQRWVREPTPRSHLGRIVQYREWQWVLAQVEKELAYI